MRADGSRVILNPSEDPTDNRLMRMMARGHLIRTGHELEGELSEPDSEGVRRFVRTCCPQDTK